MSGVLIGTSCQKTEFVIWEPSPSKLIVSYLELASNVSADFFDYLDFDSFYLKSDYSDRLAILLFRTISDDTVCLFLSDVVIIDF